MCIKILVLRVFPSCICIIPIYQQTKHHLPSTLLKRAANCGTRAEHGHCRLQLHIAFGLSKTVGTLASPFKFHNFTVAIDAYKACVVLVYSRLLSASFSFYLSHKILLNWPKPASFCTSRKLKSCRL